MCPMRIFLVLFSALLASYLAWRNFSKTEELSLFSPNEEQSEASEVNKKNGSKRQICSNVSSGFWMLVDMASGRYLWKNMRSSADRHQEMNRR